MPKQRNASNVDNQVQSFEYYNYSGIEVEVHVIYVCYIMYSNDNKLI